VIVASMSVRFLSDFVLDFYAIHGSDILLNILSCWRVCLLLSHFYSAGLDCLSIDVFRAFDLLSCCSDFRTFLFETDRAAAFLHLI